MKIVIRTLIHVIAVLVSIASSEYYRPVEQHIVTSSVSLIMGVAYFCLYTVVGLLLQRITIPRDHMEYDDELQDLEDSPPETPQREETTGEAATEAGRETGRETFQETLKASQPRSRNPCKTVVFDSEEEELLEVWRIVYGIGFAIFVTYYSVDLTSVASSISFIMGLLYMHAPQVIQDITGDTSGHVDTVFKFVGIISYVLCCFGVVIFVITACTNSEAAPDSMKFCSGMPTLRMDIIAGIIAPFVATACVHDRRSSHIYTLYKAMPFAMISSLFVIVFSSGVYIQNIVQNKPLEVICFLVNPLTKGCAAVAVITAAMQQQRVETATILAFILFCKELHFNKDNAQVFQGVCSSLILCTLSYFLCLIRGNKFFMRTMTTNCVP